jgi:phage terminase small subunit
VPLLKNLRHERFAQELANGKTAAEAYAIAGYEAHDGNASRLRGDERVRARVEQLLEAAALRVEISQSRVLAELAKIGFSDIRRVVAWHSQANVALIDNDADTEALIEEGELRFAVQNQIELLSSNDIDEDTAAAISEVSMTEKGTIKVKLHDKRGALVDIARHLGMFNDKLQLSGDLTVVINKPHAD